MWDALKSVAVERLRSRSAFWVKKAKEDLNVNPDIAMAYATEANSCADVIETLKETYEAPIEPILRSERKGRG